MAAKCVVVVWQRGDLIHFLMLHVRFQAVVTSVQLSPRVERCVTWAGEVTVKKQPFTPWGQSDVKTNKPATGTHSFSQTHRDAQTNKRALPELKTSKSRSEEFESRNSRLFNYFVGKKNIATQNWFNLAQAGLWLNNGQTLFTFISPNPLSTSKQQGYIALFTIHFF